MQRDPEISQGRRPKNATEAEFFDAAAAGGWVLSTRGWPDFFLKQGEHICVVEVKPASSRGFRREQARVLGALAGAGIPCFCWSPDGGLQRVSVGVRGLQLEDVDVKPQELLDVVGGESEGNQIVAGAPRPAPIDEPDPAGGAGPIAAVPSQSDIAAAIDSVWAVYVAVMNPRRKEIADDERLVIRNALKVATADELAVCIRTCEASDYHMKREQHINRKGGRYNQLGKILKPRPRLGESQRSRIDWWLDRSEAAGVAGFPSADPAIVNQRQVEVRRGHNSNDTEMVEKGDEAKAWLTQHGIETTIDESGQIVFHRKGGI
jgi:hypothetical protein